MNIIDEALKANETYARSYDSALARPPTPRLAIVTCMDPRLTNILQALNTGLNVWPSHYWLCLMCVYSMCVLVCRPRRNGDNEGRQR